MCWLEIVLLNRKGFTRNHFLKWNFLSDRKSSKQLEFQLGIFLELDYLYRETYYLFKILFDSAKMSIIDKIVITQLDKSHEAISITFKCITERDHIAQLFLSLINKSDAFWQWCRWMHACSADSRKIIRKGAKIIENNSIDQYIGPAYTVYYQYMISRPTLGPESD